MPVPTLGFSLSSPADDLFLGVSHELLRNVQVIHGYHYGKITQLGPAVDEKVSVVNTVKRFHGSGFVGLTFNLTFIRQLFSGK